MKRLFCIFLCILLFAGCSNKKAGEVENEIPDFTGFQTDVYTTINDVKIGANAQYYCSEKLVLTFFMPESLTGITITCENDEYKIVKDNLEFTFTESEIPFSMLCKSLEECAGNIKVADKKENCYSFNSQGHTCNLYVDPTDKTFVKLMVDGKDTLYFENFKWDELDI